MMFYVDYEILFTDMTKWISDEVPYDTQEEAEEEIDIFNQVGITEIAEEEGKTVLMSTVSSIY